MTRKTWPLLLGCIFVPAFLVGACGGGDDEDEDSPEETSTGATSSTRTSSTSNQNLNRGGSNNATGQLGRGGTNRFTQPGNFGGVLGRGGATAGRGGTTGNPFNQGGAISGTTAKAGSAGTLQNMAGNAGKSAANLAGSSNANGGAPSSGGSHPAIGGSTGIAGAPNNAVQCASGCAAISVPLEDEGVAYYVLDIPLQNVTDTTPITISAKVQSPGVASNVRIRMIVDDGDAITNACTSGAEALSSAAGSIMVSKQFTCSGLATASRAGLRIQNLSGSPQTIALYVESLSVALGAVTVSWNPSAASIGTAPGVIVLGPAAAYAGSSITYQAP